MATDPNPDYVPRRRWNDEHYIWLKARMDDLRLDAHRFAKKADELDEVDVADKLREARAAVESALGILAVHRRENEVGR